MKKSLQRDRLITLLFALTDEGVEFRNKWRGMINMAIWLLLSGLTMVLTVISVEGQIHAAIIIGMSLVKYIPLLMVVYSVARKMAAKYLDDVYELNDEYLADAFLEDVTFGQGHEQITIKEGKIPEKDERSPLILIGGPGYIQVNLDSVALLEKVTGEPEVIYPRSEPWRLGRFERIREIGKYDEVGKREYAIVNLRDQFASNIVVKSRTKDGIPIEAHDIKAIFSILRRQASGVQGESYLFDERAMQAIIYNQTSITPEPSSALGITFPWNTTVIPLIMSELERVITSHTLSEILASISQKEVNTISDNEQTIAQMRVELTGQQTPISEAKGLSAPAFKSRSRITAQFFEKPFKDKAAALGVYIDWIDIGTWKLPNTLILDKHKEAWDLSRENAKRRGAVERSKKQFETKEIVRLISNVVISNYEKSITRSSYSSSPSLKDKDTLTRKEIEALLLSTEPTSKVQQQLSRELTPQRSDPNRKASVTVAHEILKALRKEMIAGRTLIESDNKLLPEEKKRDLENIDKTLHNINALIPVHWVKKSS